MPHRASKKVMREPTRLKYGEGRRRWVQPGPCATTVPAVPNGSMHTCSKDTAHRAAPPHPGNWARATRSSGSAGVLATACTYMEIARNTGSPTRWRGGLPPTGRPRGSTACGSDWPGCVGVARLNRMLVGWANYFCLGAVSKAYRAVDDHARYWLRQWLCAKHKVKGQGTSRFPDEYLDRTLGLVKLQSRTRNFPRANA